MTHDYIVKTLHRYLRVFSFIWLNVFIESVGKISTSQRDSQNLRRWAFAPVVFYVFFLVDQLVKGFRQLTFLKSLGFLGLLHAFAEDGRGRWRGKKSLLQQQQQQKQQQPKQ